MAKYGWTGDDNELDCDSIFSRVVDEFAAAAVSPFSPPKINVQINSQELFGLWKAAEEG